MKQIIVLIIFLIAVMSYTASKLFYLFGDVGYSLYFVTLLLFFIMIGWQVLYRLQSNVYSSLWFRGFSWVGSVVFGLWGTFMLLSLPTDLFFGIFSIFVPTVGGVDLTDVAFVSSVCQGIFGLSLIIVGIGFFQAVSGPLVKHVPVTFARLPAGLRHFRIAQISDLHVGAVIRKKYVQKVVDLVNSQHPDLVVVTGDLADGLPSTLKDEVEPLRELRARYGVFFSTGNHDYYSGAELWLKKLADLGMTTLINENRVIHVGESKLLLAGITDPTGWRFMPTHESDVDAAIRSELRVDLKVLLAHQPNICVEASKAGFDLQISGHTHGGQFFPFSLLVRLAHRYYRGLNRHEKTWVYVNVGTGFWGAPLRFMVPAEISVLELGVQE